MQAGDSVPSLRRPCELLAVSRSHYYYEPGPETPENLQLMKRLDALHLKWPEYGRPKLTWELQQAGWAVNPKGVGRLMRVMGWAAIYPKPGTSRPGAGHEIYPYLLRGKAISGPDQVWCADLTCLPMRQGFMDLVAVMDWWSRYVLAWRLSNTLAADFCVDAWRAALKAGRRNPLIANTDQGAQFTRQEYIAAVEAADVRVSMDGRGRWVDNRFIQRLWRSLKYEDIYLRDYEHGRELAGGLGRWFGRYNRRRPHQALGYATPGDVYHFPESHGAKPAQWA